MSIGRRKQPSPICNTPSRPVFSLKRRQHALWDWDILAYHSVIESVNNPRSSSAPAGRGDSFTTRC